jgi:hypothetical protein
MLNICGTIEFDAVPYQYSSAAEARQELAAARQELTAARQKFAALPSVCSPTFLYTKKNKRTL